MTFDMQKNKILRQVVIILAIVIYAVGVNAFLTPAKLLSTGLGGVVVIANQLIHVNQGITMIIINIPIFIFCRKYVDKQFLVSSLICMIMLSLALGLTENLYKYINFNDVLLQSVFGGILVGIGTGIMFKLNASSGGVDFIAAVLKVRYNLSIKNTALIINFFIVCAGGIVFGAIPAMYTLISMYITYFSMDITKDLFTQNKSIFLLSEKNEEIANIIMRELGKGVTFLEAEGAYTGNKKKLIYCIVPYNYIGKIKEIVYSIDSKAFISINDVDEVRGEGFKTKTL